MPEPWLPNPAPYPPVPPDAWPAAPPPRPEATPEPTPSPRPDRKGSSALVILGAGLVALLVLVAAAALLKPRHRNVVTSSTTTLGQTSTTLAPSMTQPELDRAVDELSRFVEKQRGLRFTSPPHAVLSSDAEFRAAYQTYVRTFYGSVAQRLQGPFEAFKLASADTDLAQAVEEWMGDDQVAFYDFASRRLLVRQGALTPYVRYEIVRSLTAMVDRQHFPMAALISTDYGDAQFALRTLLEGDTQNVGSYWGGTNSPADQREIVRQIMAHQPGSSTSTEVPEALSTWLSDPLADGPVLNDVLLATGGNARLDQAFQAPPSSSALAIETARYLAGDHDAVVAAPPTDGGAPVDSQGVFGMLLLRTAMVPHVSSDLLSPAMTGYRGDFLTAWQQDGARCARIHVASVDAPATAAMETVVRSWMAEIGGTSKLVADPSRPGQQLVEATACSDGTSSPDTSPGGPGPGTDTGSGSGI